MKILKVAPILFLVIGLILLAGGARITLRTQSFRRHASAAAGVVVENVWSQDSDSSVYCPKVEFRTESGRSVTFISSVGSRPPAFHEGESVTVLYDPNDPTHAAIDTVMEQWFPSMILCGLGAVGSLIGGGWLFAVARSKRLNEWLQTNGTRIQAEYKGVELNRSVQVNGRSPYRIMAQWLNPATMSVHVFHSDNLWYDPAPFITGSTVTVLVDPKDPRRHHVDTSFLPKQVE
jgi:hypothetical protein